MSEQEKMDQWLRQAMSAELPPTVSPGFDDRLAKRLRPRRLHPSGRLVLACYALVALTISVWAMRSQSIEWSLVAISIAVPLVVTATVYRRRLFTAP